MQKTKMTLVVGLVVILAVGATQNFASTVCPVSGYSAFYSMDVDGSDESGNGNDLVNNGADFSSGEYVSMVGNGYLSGGADTNDFSTKMTISLWMYGVSDNDSSPWKFAEKWGTNERSYYFYFMNNAFHFEISDNGTNYSGHYNGFSAYYDVYDLKDRWSHLAVIFDGTAPAGQNNVFVYVTPEGQTNMAAPIISGEATIDQLYNSSANFVIAGFRSRIDGYVMYDDALNTSQLEQLYEAGRNIIVPEPTTILITILGLIGFASKKRR